MAKRKNSASDTEKNYVIYVMMDAQFQKFYVGNTTEKRIQSTMWDHYCGKIKGTKELFAADIKPEEQPNMYYLSTIQCDKDTVNSKMIPYIKLFLDHNLECLNSEKMISFAQDLHEENQELYLYIKQYSLDELCNQDTNLFPNYVEKRKKREHSSPSAITIKLTENEYNQIKKHSEKHQMTVHKYAKQAMLYDGTVIEVNFDALNESIIEKKNTNKLLKQLLYTIQKTKTYYPEDLILMQKLLDESDKLCKEMMITSRNVLKELNDIVNI